ncbi:MAG: sugar phosphate isomerase/epimerase [Clostridia bacterium]|nr:sugar phosphate isomerase/epimerase [Clostridia bacterium]
MKIGVSTASLFLRYDNEESVAVLNGLGVDVAEIFLTSFCEYKPAFARLLKERKGNMNVHSVHILNTQVEPQLFNAHHRVRADSFSTLGEIMESAGVLGAKYYTFHGGARFKKASRNPLNDDFDRIGTRIAEVADFCEDRGVTLCLENVEWATYNRPGVFSAIRARAPKIKGVLDIKQARISGYPYEEYLAEMAENIATVHLSDVREDGKMCLPGKGFFDFETLLKRLRDVGFNGALIVEAYKNDYQEIQELKESCDFLKEILYKIE